MHKKLIAVLLSASMSISALSVTGVYADESSEVIIYHTNDSHGYLEGDGESIVGIDTVAALKAGTPDSILVDAGDATQGLPIASLSKGADVIELMNAAGYDLMTAGNHEFDFGVDNFLSNVRLADFPVLAANVYMEGSPLLEGVQEGSNGCHTIIESNGLKIGFFGITTVQTAAATNPEGTRGVEFLDEVETAKREIDELNAEGADVIIAVCHMGNMDAPCTSLDLANAMTGEYRGELDAIIDGHSHTVENTMENDVLIAQTGSGMAAVGKMRVEVRGDEVQISDELLTPADLADITPDSSVSEKLSEINAAQQELLAEETGNAPTTLWAGWIGDVAPVRFVETNYGDFAADALRASAESFMADKEEDIPIVAVENGGGIREAVPNGVITKGSLISTFPFSNTVYLKKITPKVLYEMMEVSGTLLDGQDPETGMLLQMSISGGFLQISGFTVVFDPDSTGDKVVSITLEGESQPLDRNDDTTEIMLVGNNYILSGGNDYTMLADLPKYGETGGELEAIEAYLESKLVDGVLTGYEGIKNRIVMQGDYTPRDYTAYINVTDEAGNALANTEVYYRVDGGNQLKGTTDSDGLLAVTLSDGPHGVRIEDNREEVYIDNYTGIGIIEDSIRQFPTLVYTGESAENTTEAATETTTQAAASSSDKTDDSSRGGSGSSSDKAQSGENIEYSSEQTSESTTNGESLSVSISADSSEITVGESTFETDSSPYIKNGSLMVPLRMVALAVCGDDLSQADSSSAVKWDTDLKKASITTHGGIIEFTAGSNTMTVSGTSSAMSNGAAAEITNDRMYVPFRALGEALGADVNWDEASMTAVYTIE